MNNNTNDNINKHDEFYNICQIVLRYELIYLFKFFVFIGVLFTIFIKFDSNTIDGITKQDVVGISTFIFTITIDCVILAISISNNLKGRINLIHLSFCVLMFGFSIFVFLILIEKVKVCSSVLFFCDLISIISCISPLLELVYDTLLHLQNEKEKNYI